MKKHRILPFLLSAAILAVSLLAASFSNTIKEEKSTPDEKASTSQKEMRGLWVSYITLDTENSSDCEIAFKRKTDEIITTAKEYGFNTLIVQARPFSDALYPSEHYPWSHIITGVQGEDPGFDPLSYICGAANENSIGIHIWINPYRIATAETPKELSKDNVYNKHMDMCFKTESGIYLDPADSRSRELIINGVTEIVENYDIEGIQFDDYFYPEDCGDFDKDEYEDYKNSKASPLSLSDWRIENVNMLIRGTYKAIHDSKKNCVFGISPQGNLHNNENIYADVAKWCTEEGYIDYICPQLYFSLDNPAKGFEEAFEEWIDIKRDGLSLYCGLAGYKAGTDADEGTWLDNSDILKTEIDISREKGADGFMLYSYDSIYAEEAKEEMNNIKTQLSNSPTQ